MIPYTLFDINQLLIIGISHKKTDAQIRGQFAVNEQQYSAILEQAKMEQVHGLFLISTCNRTELYATSGDREQLISLLCNHTTGDKETFRQYAYMKNGQQAITHFFAVASGLDSQLIGDYEIVGQLKQAFRFAKERNCVNFFLERLYNQAQQASKEIKNRTQLSNGSVSISVAAVQRVKEVLDRDHLQRILLIGIGHIGQNIAKNLVKYFPPAQVTLLNRSMEKAARLAAELGMAFGDLHDLQQHLDASPIIIVATGAGQPVVFSSHFKTGAAKVIIDLSIPCNVESAVSEIAGINLINIDEVLAQKELVIQSRSEEIPKAKQIIDEHLSEFKEWIEARHNAPALKATKMMLTDIALQHVAWPDQTLNSCPVNSTDQQIKSILKKTAEKMRRTPAIGCHQLDAILEFIKLVK